MGFAKCLKPCAGAAQVAAGAGGEIKSAKQLDEKYRVCRMRPSLCRKHKATLFKK